MSAAVGGDSTIDGSALRGGGGDTTIDRLAVGDASGCDTTIRVACQSWSSPCGSHRHRISLPVLFPRFGNFGCSCIDGCIDRGARGSRVCELRKRTIE